jgi:hypothetical protein
MCPSLQIRDKRKARSSGSGHDLTRHQLTAGAHRHLGGRDLTKPEYVIARGFSLGGTTGVRDMGPRGTPHAVVAWWAGGMTCSARRAFHSSRLKHQGPGASERASGPGPEKGSGLAQTWMRSGLELFPSSSGPD